ncbi:MAG: SLC13 family permease, partial [Planctomycetaceae bacterium]
LSYAAVFGGICTLIGTSTNLVVNGFLLRDNLPGLKMFDLAWVGIPCSLVGIAYLVLLGRWLLPDRKPAISLSDDPRQYTVEMIVDAGGPLVGKSIEAAGLRHLPGLYLAEIDRGGEILAAVAPKTKLQAEDRLVFAGILESVVDLRRIRGLSPATNQTFKLDAPRTQRCMIEAVVSDRCPLVGKTIREGRFRTNYNAAVLALARSGKRIAGKLGDIELRPGDTLLLEAHGDFVTNQRNSSDFFLVSRVENSSPPRHEKAPIALTILIALVLLVSLEWVDMLSAGLIALCLMVFSRCCTGTEARQAIDWQVLITIGAALGIGAAIKMSGLAEAVSGNLIGLAGGKPWMVLAMVYFVTLLFTELLTNNAAAALVYPIAITTASRLEVSYMPFIIVIMIAASSGFATPFGYQTHMMVYGPGGYRFSDFLRVGIPLDMLFMAVSVAITPIFFPF